MLNFLQNLGLVVLLFFAFSSQGFAQCENPTVDLPDANHPVDGNLANAYCVTLSFDPAMTGFPTGIQMDLTHTFQGDLSISVTANGNTLNVVQRPGALGNCTGGCTCGSSANLGGTYSFEDGNTNDPEDVMAAGGGDYGVTADDGCGIGTPGITSFADLWATYAPGELVDAEICITDHAGADVGVAADITFLFPNPVTCGCTDPDAINFDPNAEIDDGSCFYDCPDLGLTLAEDYFEFCAGDNTINLIGNAPDVDNPTYEWTATNGGDGYIQDPFSSNTSADIPSDFDGQIIFTLTVYDEFGCEEFLEVEVNVGAPPEVEITGPDEICIGELAELNLIGGPYADIFWPSTGDNTSTVFVDPGLHTVIVEDAFGCQNTADFLVESFPEETPTILGPPVICIVDGEALLEPDDTYVSYEWSTGENSFDIIVTEPGDYELTVEDNNGCFSEAYFILAPAPPVDVNIIGDSDICEGETTLLEATFGFVSYEWDTGETTTDIQVDFSDTYSVTVEDNNGCFGEATFDLTVNELPDPVIVGPDVLCPGEFISLSTEDPYSSYDWTTGSSSQSTTVTTTGTVSVTVTDNAGCSNETEIEIISGGEVDAEIQGDLFFCPGDQTQVTATPGYDMYAWSNNEDSNEIDIDQAGQYELTITNSEGCTQELIIDVVELTPPTVEITGDDYICFETTTNLQVDNIYSSYEWSTSDITNEIQIDQTDTYTITVTDEFGCIGEDDFTVTVGDEIIPDITGPEELCPNAPSEISIVGSFSSVDWSNGFTNTNIAQIVGPGDYSVDVFDNNGCPGTASIFIGETEPEPVDIFGLSEMCAGTSQELTTSGDFADFLWSNDETTAAINITEPGNYWVIAIDADGCESFTSIDIALSPALEPSINGVFEVCPDGSTILTTETGFDSYTWSNGGSSNEQLTAGVGDYTVTVMNNDGCEGQASVTVEELTPPSPQIQGDLILCEDEISTLSLSQSYTTYSWNTTSDLATIDVDQGTTYSVTVTDGNGCTGEDQVTLEDIIVSVEITGDNDFCEGMSTTISVPDNFSSYAWSTGGDSNETTSSTEGNISILVTDENGCTATDDIDITVYPLPEVEINGRLTYCPNGATVINATPGYTTYEWSNNENTASIQINQESNYSVTVTDNNGCQEESNVFVAEEPELDIDIIGDPDFCAGLSTSLTVEGDYVSFVWSNDLNTSEITVTEGGVIGVVVTDEFGCTGTDNIDITSFPLPEPSILGELNFCAGESTQLNGGNYETYAWSIGGMDTQFIDVNTPQMVSLTVTDENGCIGSTTEQLIEDALPIHEIQGIPGFCPDESTILNGEEGYLAYDWSTNSSATSIIADATQSYQLSVTDGNGCIGVASIDVAEYATVLPNIQGDDQFCPEGNTTLSVVNNFESYNWTTGEQTDAITTTNTGDVTVIVTDINGCETENSVNLSLFEVIPPTIDAVDGFCTGTSATLTASAGYSSYNWSNTEITNAVSVSDGGLYSVDVIDTNGCASDAVISITEYDLPTPEIGGSLTFCTDLSTTLNAGAVYTSYAWSTGGSDSELTVAVQGPIGLTVTDENTCIGSTSEFVQEATELSPVISGDLDFCTGENTELSAGNGFETYLWSNGSTDPSITVDTAGVYSIFVTDEGGCNGTADVAVIENALPQPAINGLLAFCQGLETELSSSEVYPTYEWSTGAPTPMITVNTADDYMLTVIDDNDCVNSVMVTVAEQSLPVYDIVGDDEFCITSSTSLTIEPAYASYNWSIDSDQQTISVNSSGIVAVTVTDAFGCEASQNIQLSTVDLPLADAGNIQTLDCEILAVALGGESNPTGNYSYEWTGPGITAETANQLHPQVGEEGDYSLIVTNEDFDCVSLPAAVTVDDAAFEPQVVIEVLDILDCVTETVQLDARDSDSGQSFVYQWFDSDLNPIANANSLVYQASTAQFYTLQILDTLTSCANMASAEVEENNAYPFAEAGSPQLITCGDPIAFLNGTASEQGGQIQFTWTSADGSFTSNPMADSVQVDQPGLYFLQVEDIINGCGNIDSVFVTENIAYPIVMTTDDFELDCLEPTTLLSGQGSSTGSIYSSQWLVNQSPIEGTTNQLQLEVDSPGNYTLQITNIENDCVTEEIVEITLNPAAPQSVSYISDRPTCAGDDDGSILVTGTNGGTPPFLYSLDGAPFGDLEPYENLTAGIYDITVQDAIGCILHSELEVIDGNDLRLELGPDQYLLEGELADIYPEITIDSSKLVSIDWQTAAQLECPECIYQLDLQLNESTQFFLSLKDENGCKVDDNLTIFIQKDRPIYVPTAFTPNEDGDNDIFYIFSGNDNVKINSFLVFNRWGETVFEVYNSHPNDPRWGWDGKHRGQEVNTAVYVWFAEIEFANGDVEVIKGDVTVMH